MIMDTEKRITELKQEQNDLLEKYHEIGMLIKEMEIKEYNYEGKYIYIPEYGYMFVSWQKYDKNSIYNDERMFFQGFKFNGSSSPYIDDFWIDIDAMEEWWIPIDTFQRYVRDNEIKVLNREEFINTIKKEYNEFMSKFDNMIENCEIEYEYKHINK